MRQFPWLRNAVEYGTDGVIAGLAWNGTGIFLPVVTG
jgi:hypothetical protein